MTHGAHDSSDAVERSQLHTYLRIPHHIQQRKFYTFLSSNSVVSFGQMISRVSFRRFPESKIKALLILVGTCMREYARKIPISKAPYLVCAILQVPHHRNTSTPVRRFNMHQLQKIVSSHFITQSISSWVTRICAFVSIPISLVQNNQVRKFMLTFLCKIAREQCFGVHP